MKIKHVANFVKFHQDGAIWNDFFFTLNTDGTCTVYDMKTVGNDSEKDLKQLHEFVLDKSELIVPHSNSVVFGNEFYEPGDEFPILYSNMYNNCAKFEDKHVGECLAYRIQKDGDKFTSTLLQIIKIGFTDNDDYWCSPEHDDVRPYGNFVVDRENNTYWAFTMRDKTHTTRYFSFDMPSVFDGVFDNTYGAKKVTLYIEDIKTFFDCEYHNYIQGACFNDGKVYSVEGFSKKSGKLPALRVIDVNEKKQILHVNFGDFDLDIEPEMIDFYNGMCCYSDAHGHMYTIEF